MNWLHKIDIKQFMYDENGDSNPLSQCGPLIIQEIKTLIPVLTPKEVVFLEDNVFYPMNEAIEENDIEYFDDALNDLYDWADEKKVWLGL